MAENVPNLGEPITGSAHRDAVHIAVFPATAGCPLNPGDHVGVEDDYAHPSYEHVGIVDPYLKKPVKRGERVYILLYPGTIATLRHEWMHPIIDKKAVQQLKNEIFHKDSLEYIANEAERAGLSVEELMKAAGDYLEFGEYLCDGGRWEGYSLGDNFWGHYEKLTGERVSQSDRGSFFSCSC